MADRPGNRGRVVVRGREHRLRWLVPIQARRHPLGQAAGEGFKILLDHRHPSGILFDRLVDGHSFTEVSENPFQPVKPETLHEELDCKGGLVIGKLQVEIGLRRQKRTAQL